MPAFGALGDDLAVGDDVVLADVPWHQGDFEACFLLQLGSETRCPRAVASTGAVVDLDRPARMRIFSAHFGSFLSGAVISGAPYF